MQIRRRQPKPSFEVIQPAAAASFAARQFVTSHFPFVWHYHPEAELTLILRGSGLRFVGESIETFEPGDLILIGSDVPHTWQSSPQRGTDVEAICVQFRPDLWGSQDDCPPELSRTNQLLIDARAGLRVLSPRVRQQVVDLLHEMMDAKEGSLCRYHTLLRALDSLTEAYFRQSGSALIRLAPVPQSLAGDDRQGSDGKVKLVLNRLQQSMTDGRLFRQKEAATLAGMSQQSFSRFFHRQVGRTFVRYVNEWRVNLACRALVQSDSPITAIAFDCGFENLSNFNRQFKQIKRTTPREFRMAGALNRA